MKLINNTLDAKVTSQAQINEGLRGFSPYSLNE